MAEKVIYLVRHGITHSNIEKVYAGWSDEELTEDGITQADRLGKEIQKLGISAIYVSPLKRGIQTAQILNQYINAKLNLEPHLKEMKMGHWEGLSEFEVAMKYPLEYKIWQERPADLKLYGRETLKEVQRRALKAINRILEQEEGLVSLAVTHVAIIRCLFLYYKKRSLNTYKAIYVPNVSVQELTFHNGKITIDRIK